MARKDKDAPDERTRRLEALRDDCHRHQDDCVRLVLVEAGRIGFFASTRWVVKALKDGPTIEMALLGGADAAQQRCIGLLARLGEELPESRDFAADADLRAMFAIAMRRDGRTSWEAPNGGMTLPLPDMTGEGSTIERIEGGWRAAGMIEATRREVPDVRAAIAAECEELLRASGNKARRQGLDEFRAAAMLELARLRKVFRREPTNKEIAEAMQVHPSGISQRLANDPTWIKARAMDGRAPRAVNLEGEGVGLAESDRKPNAIEEDFFDSQAPAPKRVSAKRRQD